MPVGSVLADPRCRRPLCMTRTIYTKSFKCTALLDAKIRPNYSTELKLQLCPLANHFVRSARNVVVSPRGPNPYIPKSATKGMVDRN